LILRRVNYIRFIKQNKYFVYIERKKNMNEFIELLDELYSNCEVDENNLFVGELEVKASNTACDLLIDNQGHCNWENISIVREAGYRVYAGDKDSFGWLVGCIQKHGSESVLTYG
jgi:hypothetical protein